MPENCPEKLHKLLEINGDLLVSGSHTTVIWRYSQVTFSLFLIIQGWNEFVSGYVSNVKHRLHVRSYSW